MTPYLFPDMEDGESVELSAGLNNKLFGAAAASGFCHECMVRGWATSITLCDSMPYDIIVDVGMGSKLVKCQIKATKSLDKDRYHITTAHGCDSKERYSASHIDILAAYVFGDRIKKWFIIPVKDVSSVVSINLPLSGSGGWWCYENNWSAIERAASN